MLPYLSRHVKCTVMGFPGSFALLSGASPESVKRAIVFVHGFFGSSRKHLMELKAVPAKVEKCRPIGEVSRELERLGHKNVFLRLVAPSIPKQTGAFLDRLGIEHEEIHEAEYRQVALRHGYTFKSDTRQTGVTGDIPQANSRTAFSAVGGGFQVAKSNVGSEQEFLCRCDERGKQFFAGLFDKQRTLSARTKIMWDHECGFSMQFYFPRAGFVAFGGDFLPVT